MTKILCLFPDLHGIARGKLTNRTVEDRMTLGFSPGVFAKDIYGHPHLFDDLVIPVGASDMTVEMLGDEIRPFARTVEIDLFGADALVIGRAKAADGTPHRFDIRAVLERYLSANPEAQHIRIGAELEFYLLGGQNDLPADGQAYAFGGLAGKQHCISAILNALDAAGIEWLDLSQENEVDQYEISLKHTHPLEQADRVFLARMIIRHVAARFGLRATFIAVNAMNQAPSNLHLHISCTSLSVERLAQALQRTLVPAFVIYRPSRNSRYTKYIESFASRKADIGEGSRFSAIRIIRNGLEERIELRTPTSDTNPYFTILVVVSAILKEPQDTVSNDTKLDFSIKSSLAAFLASDLAPQIFDAEGLRLYAKLKRAEVRSAKAFGGFEAERAALLRVL